MTPRNPLPLKMRVASPSSILAAALLIISATTATPHAAFAAPEKSVSAAPLEVTYYYLPT